MISFLKINFFTNKNLFFLQDSGKNAAPYSLDFIGEKGVVILVNIVTDNQKRSRHTFNGLVKKTGYVSFFFLKI